MARREVAQELLEQIVTPGDDEQTLEVRVAMAQEIRAVARDPSVIDRFLIDRAMTTRAALEVAQANQNELRELIDEVTAPPYIPALYLGTAATGRGQLALVMHGSARRAVAFGPELGESDFVVGDPVFLNHELNVLVGRAPDESGQAGETATFLRRTSGGRAVLRVHDEEVVARLGGALQDADLHEGDIIRWDRTAMLALERMRETPMQGMFLEEVAAEGFECIGGLERQIEEIKNNIEIFLHHADHARRYHLAPKRSVLLVGPPGMGKTLLARSLAHWMGEISPSGRARFMNIKPAALHSMWYGQTEQNYRDVFAAAREVAARETSVPVVMFFDEVDSIGGVRGASFHQIDDRVLNAFMAELNGLQDRGNILVVAATNRKDVLDPALLRPGRLGDLILEIGRPNLSGARKIFAKHLSPDIPYAPEESHEDAIEACLAHMFAPNADNALATLTFRDGTRRTVRAADIVSGALIANVVVGAKYRAVIRELKMREEGLRTADVLSALENELETAARALTPQNCHDHLTDLPSDAHVVRVELPSRRVAHPRKYRAA